MHTFMIKARQIDSHYTTEPESQYANVQLTSPYGAPYSHVSHQNYQPMPHRPFRSNYPQPPGLPFSYFHPGGYPLPPPPSPPRHESHLQREVCLADIQSRAHTEWWVTPPKKVRLWLTPCFLRQVLLNYDILVFDLYWSQPWRPPIEHVK